MRSCYCLLFLLVQAAGLAYEPPVDTAGPLTARIQQPALGSYGAGGLVQFNQPDAPFTLPVQLSNSSDAPLQGTLRLRVIDRWRAEPDGPVPFTLRPRGRANVSFRVSFGPGTFNAHYPIHALAEFEYEGRRLVAHPIMIVTTTQANTPRAPLPVEWKPVPVPRTGPWGCGGRRCGASARPSAPRPRSRAPPDWQHPNSGPTSSTRRASSAVRRLP